MKRFKYLKNHCTYGGVKTKMPTKIKQLTQLYSSLDLNDLEYLEFKAQKEYDKYKIKALDFALSNKSNETDIIRAEFEGRLMKEIPTTEELIRKMNYDFIIRDLGCINDE